MQDMATMQQPLVTSPATAGAVQESSALAIGGGGEVQQETSRTDVETCEENEETVQSARHLDMDNDAASDLNNESRNGECREAAVEKTNSPEREADDDDVEDDDDDDDDDDSDARVPESGGGDDSASSYTCPICDVVLGSQHDFTLHIRSHNNDCGEAVATPLGTFVCRVCGKALSSSSSLDRHVLVHSGERPFRCCVCGVSFTTNGNMHRHMRTHGEDGPCPLGAKRRRLGSPSPGDVDKRKVLDLSMDGEDAVRRKLKTATQPKETEQMQVQRVQCPVCCRVDFASLNVLEMHLEERHPEYKARCHLCNLIFKNHRALNLHRTMKHFGEEVDKAATVLGFRDLTFVDFSSEKFPIIAKTLCEQSLHRASSMFHRFQCERCVRAFPCGKALAIHRQSCDGVRGAGPVDYESEEEHKQDDFLAHLDLQTKSASLSPPPDYLSKEDSFASDPYFNGERDIDGERDLANIQSILSLTSAETLLQELSVSPRPRSDITPPDSATKSSDSGNGADDEQQDCFAAEFRRMKLKGEFPCRLCTAVFPNLRALKGHNRVHLTASSGLHRCNMCPFSNPDKAVLVRHMRTHNGDRPYECALCNYAFTTKANCERHLRNRHSKLSRDEVKNSIIYHPSEDPTNDPDGQIKALSTREEVKRTLVFSSHSNDGSTTEHQEQQDCIKLPDDENSRPLTNFVPKRMLQTQNRSWETHEVATMTNFADDEEMQDSDDNQTVSDDSVLVNLTKNNNNMIKNNFMFKSHSEDQRLFMKEQVRTSTPCTQFVKKCDCYEQHNEDKNDRDDMMEDEVDDDDNDDDDDDEIDTPLDLSMDALDLSKKKPISTVQFGVKDEIETQPQDLSKKSLVHNAELNKLTLVQPVFAPPQKLPVSTNIIPQTVSPAIYKCSLSPLGHSTSPMPKVELKGGNMYQGHALYLNNNGYFRAQPQFQIPYPMSPYNHNLFSESNMKDLAEMKERLQKELIRGLQLTSGGKLLDPVMMADRVQAFHGLAEMCARPKPEIKIDYAESKIKIESAGNSGLPPTVDNKEGIVNNSPMTPPKLTVSPKPIVREKDSSASVKMVIKNGVLMPKQKQRRYRTERPFSCEFCSARFTLRSNMERHIKQQHPQCWSQRQRSGGALSRRGNTAALPHSQDSRSSLDSLGHVDLNVPSLDNEKQTKVEEAPKTALEMDLKQVKEILPDSAINKMNGNNNNNKPYISEEVKLAIAQQLKSKLNQSSANAFVKTEDEEEDDDGLVIDEEKEATGEEVDQQRIGKEDGVVDLASVSRLLDNATTQNRAFQQYFPVTQDGEEEGRGEGSEDDEEGLVAGSNSEGNNSGSDENRSESETHSNSSEIKKKSAYSLAPNRVSCPYCNRKFPWSSSLRRHVLTHTGQKPFKCPHCPLLFTTKSNCDRHLLRKHAGHGNVANTSNTGLSTPTNTSNTTVSSNTSSSCGEASPPSTNGYTMRNVPDRPFKCKFCPSSTFSTQSNLRKHTSSKHSNSTSNGPLSPGAIARNSLSGDENHCMGAEDSNSEDVDDHELEISTGRSLSLPEKDSYPQPELKSPLPVLDVVVPKTVAAFDNHSSGMSTSSSVSSSDLPFKCHLCEGSYAERQEALDHIRDHHPPEFELLMSKGALETTAGNDDGAQHVGAHDEGSTAGDENLEQLRGKFPDYANRKVMCAFCLRRFWSAEDLRRHMRTHTGERPFSCDICRRRFTLKHSMLRHRKKHNPLSTPQPDDFSMVSGDEEGNHCGMIVNVPRPPPPLNISVGAEKLQKSQLKLINHNNNNITPNNGLTSNFTWDSNKVDFTISAAQILSSKFASDKKDDVLEQDTGLIEKMLDIQDKSIIEKVLLSKSPEDAAKLLGMKNGSHE